MSMELDDGVVLDGAERAGCNLRDAYRAGGLRDPRDSCSATRGLAIKLGSMRIKMGKLGSMRIKMGRAASDDNVS